MLIRRTAFVALVNTIDWWDTSDLFFDATGERPVNPVGQAGPINLKLRLWTATNSARDDITLTWQKWEGGAWVTAPGSVAEGLPGGAAGTYSASSPVYADSNHRWIFGRTLRLGDLANYFVYVYLQFRNVITEDLGHYRAVATVDYDGAGAGAAVTAYSALSRSTAIELEE
jgi:hypothetical protein